MSTINFNKITGDEVELFLGYPELFENFWSELDLLMDTDVTDSELQSNKEYYEDLLKFGAIRRNIDLIVPANMPFKIVKTHAHYAFFNIMRNGAELEIAELSELSLSAELTPLGEKVRTIAMEQHITMLEAIEQLQYYAKILNVSIE